MLIKFIHSSIMDKGKNIKTQWDEDQHHIKKKKKNLTGRGQQIRYIPTFSYHRFTTQKNQYYLRIFTHGSESVGKFIITYEQHYLRTLPADSESIGKFSITYQLLPTDLIIYGYLLPTNYYHKSLLPTNYHLRISITYQLLS